LTADSELGLPAAQTCCGDGVSMMPYFRSPWVRLVLKVKELNPVTCCPENIVRKFAVELFADHKDYTSILSAISGLLLTYK